MTGSRSSYVFARRAIDEIDEFSSETETPKYIKVFIQQEITEARRFLRTLRDEVHGAKSSLSQVNAMIGEMEAMNDPNKYFDSLMCLRDSRRKGNDKLLLLNESIAGVKEDISTLEGHLEIMDAAINSE
nr:hypothetical protein [Tanacetum cinerariifolium]